MSHRPRLLGSAVRTFIADAARRIPPEIATVVSITRVSVSNDRSYATVFLTALSHPERALSYLRERKGELKREMGSALQLTRVPELRFAIDEDPERSSRIEELLG